MKFLPSIIAAVSLAIPCVRATSLIRGNVKAEEPLTEAEFGTATIIISNVSTKGKWNNQVVSDAFKKAYNDVHTGQNVPYVEWSFVDTEVEIPIDSEHWESNNWCRYKYVCPDCSPGDSKDKQILPPMMLKALKYPDLHAEFETTFCKLIAEAEPASFGEVDKCWIDFTYTLSDAWGHHDHSDDDDKKEDFQMTIRGDLDISHVLETADEDSLLLNRISVMGNCFQSSYNLVHSDTPYSVQNFGVTREIDVPEDDDDKDTHVAAAGGLKRTWRFNRSYSYWSGSVGCRYCGPDDRKFVPPVLTMGQHQAFEAIFANCLRESGVSAFAKVSNPHIRFSYTDKNDGEVMA